MLKLYKFSKWYWFIFIALLLISLVIFLYYFYWLKFHNKVAIKIEVDDYKKLSFTINS
ncbi:MAG1140 family protein, partial [Mesomycoplasma hyorhinis]